jgi:N-acetylmuramoyl-L-alanine amidase
MTMAVQIGLRHRLHAAVPAAAVLAAVILAVPAPVSAQTAGTLFERAQAREASALKSASAATLRAAATAYENIVRRYPTSGYCDNALWQAAELMRLAYEKSAAAADRDKAERYLTWLRDEYPHSALVKDARRALTRLASPPAAAPAASTAQPAPTLSVPTALAGGTAVVRSVTRTPLPRGDRITIELTREVGYRGDRVDGPDRLFFDFASSKPASALDGTVGQLSGTLVKEFRIGRHPNDVTRVVLELAGAPKHSAFLLYDPFRLVVDLESAPPPANARPASPPPTPAAFPAAAVPPPSDRTAGTGAAKMPEKSPARTPDVPVKVTTGGLTATAIADDPPPAVVEPPPAVVEPPPAVEPPPPAAVDVPPPAPVEASKPAESEGRPQPPASTSKGDYSLARQLGLSVSRIVIDAGHGGHDPGAQANGLVEADLVLDVARRLEALLAAHPGMDVVLTRKDDTFIALEERTAIAKRENADLFLSIHANASRVTATRGVETYLLNFATNEAAEAVAARENATSARSMSKLPEILRTIALNNKLAESRELATMVQTALVRSLRTQSTGVRDLGVKQAPFVVLIGTEMPSVLVEISFLTNKAEAALLKQGSYRQRIAQALYDAVVKYQASLKKITTVASREESR